MPVMFHKKTLPSRDDERIAAAVGPFVALELELDPVSQIKFVCEAAPSRNAFWTHERACGFVRGDTVFVATGLTPTSLARTIAHEFAHIKQMRLACQTKKVTQSVAIDERDARLTEWEIFGDLPRRATVDEVLAYVRQRHQKLLREKFAPRLRQMAENYAARLPSGGLRISEIEYR